LSDACINPFKKVEPLTFASQSVVRPLMEMDTWPVGVELVLDNKLKAGDG
jgi:hypothetical protein